MVASGRAVPGRVPEFPRVVLPLNVPSARAWRGVPAGSAGTGPAGTDLAGPGPRRVRPLPGQAGAAARAPDVLRGQRLARDPPVAAADFLDHDPGDRAHVLALNGDHRVGELFDDPALLLGDGHVLDELDVDERHFFSLASAVHDLR